MKEELLKFINQTHPSYKDIVSHFCDEDVSFINEMLLICEESGLIEKFGSTYYLAQELNLVPGTIISIKDRFSFASIGEEEDVYINNDNLKNAFLNDTVLLKKISTRFDSKEEYCVERIVHRANTTVTGEVYVEGKIKFLKVGNIAAPKIKFVIQEKNITVNKREIVTAKVVKVFPDYALVEPTSVVGNKNEVGIDVARIILANNAPLIFPEEVIEQVKSIPSTVEEHEKVGREDFRDHLIVTIDGDDAKDFDDAVEVEFKDGLYHVGVHIADVSHYVVENTPLDKEALNRATSLYVTDRVVPMLPFELSNGICSLNPNQERLVTSCLFTMDKNGKIISTKLCKGLIKSSYRLTYKYVNKFLDEEAKQRDNYSPLEKMLIQLNEVSTTLRKKRNKAGNIELSSTELVFKLDEKGYPYEVEKRKQGTGEELIEELMITANEIVASTIEKMKLAMIYRIHEQPRARKLESYFNLSKHYGYPCEFSLLTCTPKDVSSYLNGINNEDDREILSSLLLRCMAKAKYSTQNKKHFGLASKSYTHFTSPIRRYPDLIVHRLIDKYIVNNDKTNSNQFVEELSIKAQLCSQRERRALSIERTVEDLLSAKYLSKHLGDEYDAKIVSMTTQGMFVELENGIQGMLPFETIPGDYYIFDENIYCAFGARKGKIFKLGQIVHIIVSNVDIEHRQVTFAYVTKMNRERGRSNGRKR